MKKPIKQWTSPSPRAIISYLAAIELRHSGAKIASELRLSEKSVSRCIERGKKLVDNDKKLLEYL